MKRFQFKLQSLLNYKKHLEEMARQEMARAVADVNACQEQIQSLGQTRKDAGKRLERLVEKGIGAAEFKLHNGFLSIVDQMIIEERQRKVRLEKVLDEKRSMLTKRTIDKKAMERLWERRAQEYTQEMLREEQKALDEVAALKTVRERADERK